MAANRNPVATDDLVPTTREITIALIRRRLLKRLYQPNITRVLRRLEMDGYADFDYHPVVEAVRDIECSFDKKMIDQVMETVWENTSRDLSDAEALCVFKSSLSQLTEIGAMSWQRIALILTIVSSLAEDTFDMRDEDRIFLLSDWTKRYFRQSNIEAWIAASNGWNDIKRFGKTCLESSVPRSPNYSRSYSECDSPDLSSPKSRFVPESSHPRRRMQSESRKKTAHPYMDLANLNKKLGKLDDTRYHSTYKAPGGICFPSSKQKSSYSCANPSLPSASRKSMLARGRDRAALGCSTNRVRSPRRSISFDLDGNEPKKICLQKEEEEIHTAPKPPISSLTEENLRLHTLKHAENKDISSKIEGKIPKAPRRCDPLSATLTSLPVSELPTHVTQQALKSIRNGLSSNRNAATEEEVPFPEPFYYSSASEEKRSHLSKQDYSSKKEVLPEPTPEEQCDAEKEFSYSLTFSSTGTEKDSTPWQMKVSVSDSETDKPGKRQQQHKPSNTIDETDKHPPSPFRREEDGLTPSASPGNSSNGYKLSSSSSDETDLQQITPPFNHNYVLDLPNLDATDDQVPELIAVDAEDDEGPQLTKSDSDSQRGFYTAEEDHYSTAGSFV